MQKKLDKTVSDIYDKSKNSLLNLKEAVFGKLDQNDDGEIGIDDIIVLTMKTPGCCYRLKNTLRDTMLSNPNHKSLDEEDIFLNFIISGEIIETDYEDCVPSADDAQACFWQV